MAQMKRSRIEKSQKPRKKHRSLSTNTTSLKAIPLDKLAWQEVGLPDRLEDAEGFFGLEEIDDVDVLRDSENGRVQYRVVSDGHNDSESALRNSEEATASEWEGFGTDDGNGNAAEPTQVHPAQNVPKKDKKKQKSRKEAPQAASQKGAGNAFELLPDLDDESVDVAAWGELELSDATLLSLSKMRFSKPTPIQRAAIPHVCNGLDVIGKASTGSGKTLAFGIPIIEHFIKTGGPQQEDIGDVKKRTRPPVAMILSPTRELAHQLSKHLGDLCTHFTVPSPRIATITGGLSLHKQQRVLATADIIIGTPGRLWEIISSTAGLLQWLRQIKFLVVDEADRLLSEGHFQEVEEILNSLDREDVEEDGSSDESSTETFSTKAQRQTLVFSATFEKDLQRKLAGKGRPQATTKNQSMEYLLQKLSFRSPQPKFIDVNPLSQMASNLREGLVECGALEKDLYLYALLLHHPNARTLAFTNSISAVRRIVSLLQNLNLPALGLHSEMEQKARLRSLERFSGAKPTPGAPTKGAILVATDVAARGLDIPNVELVLHYHAPRAADAYVHRSGRTARGDASGASIMLCSPDEVVPVRRLIAKIHARSADVKTGAGLRTLDVDRRIVNRLKPRVGLAKKIADATMAKEKSSAEDNWLKNAAEELGVEWGEEEFVVGMGGGKGMGKGRARKMREAGGMSKEEMGRLRAELKSELGKRVNVGVSEKYLTAGGVDVGALLEGHDGPFLGGVGGIGLE